MEREMSGLLKEYGYRFYRGRWTIFSLIIKPALRLLCQGSGGTVPNLRSVGDPLYDMHASPIEEGVNMVSVPGPFLRCMKSGLGTIMLQITGRRVFLHMAERKFTTE
jgi:hypothetical protein